MLTHRPRLDPGPNRRGRTERPDSSTLQLRQDSWITNAAETLGSVVTNASSRHFHTAIGSVWLPPDQRISRITWTLLFRVDFGKLISINSAGYVVVSSTIALGVGNHFLFFCRRPR